MFLTEFGQRFDYKPVYKQRNGFHLSTSQHSGNADFSLMSLNFYKLSLFSFYKETENEKDKRMSLYNTDLLFLSKKTLLLFSKAR